MSKPTDAQAALDRLTNLEAEAAELRKLLSRQPEAPAPKLWVPKLWFIYHLVGRGGRVYSHRHTVMSLADDEVIPHSAIFSDSSTAARAAPHLRSANKLIQAAYQADPDAGGWIKGAREWTIMRRAATAPWTGVKIGQATPTGALVYTHDVEQADQWAAIVNAEGVV